MYIKYLGVVLVIAGCAGTGISMAAEHTREIRTLQQIAAALEYMESELRYRMTPLPELCVSTAKQVNGTIKKVLELLAEELDRQISPNVSCCMRGALKKAGYVPPISSVILERVGACLGLFDLQGQLKALESVAAECRQHLQQLNENRESRLRSYQTLGICAGAALVILLI